MKIPSMESRMHVEKSSVIKKLEAILLSVNPEKPDLKLIKEIKAAGEKDFAEACLDSDVKKELEKKISICIATRPENTAKASLFAKELISILPPAVVEEICLSSAVQEQLAGRFYNIISIASPSNYRKLIDLLKVISDMLPVAAVNSALASEKVKGALGERVVLMRSFSTNKEAQNLVQELQKFLHLDQSSNSNAVR